MSTCKIVAKLVVGQTATERERSALSSILLAQLAAGGFIELTPLERRRLSKAMLTQLAIGGRVDLTRSERDDLSCYPLALLAASGVLEVQQAEIARLPTLLQDAVTVANQSHITWSGRDAATLRSLLSRRYLRTSDS